MSNEARSKEHIEQVRNERIKITIEHANENKESVEEALDRVIEFLQANRGHIGGIAFNVIPLDGDALYDPRDDDASEGISMLAGVDRSSRILMNHCLDDMIRKSKVGFEENSDPLAALMANFR